MKDEKELHPSAFNLPPSPRGEHGNLPMDTLGTVPCATALNGEASKAPHVSSTSSRVRVDGKFFARGGQRLRLQGVTYGPFAPNADGDAFPTPQRVGDDFQGLRDAGLNAVR